MSTVTRTSEGPASPRPDASSSPRGEELRDASRAFAELVNRDRREQRAGGRPESTRAPKPGSPTDDDRTDRVVGEESSPDVANDPASSILGVFAQGAASGHRPVDPDRGRRGSLDVEVEREHWSRGRDAMSSSDTLSESDRSLRLGEGASTSSDQGDSSSSGGMTWETPIIRGGSESDQGRDSGLVEEPVSAEAGLVATGVSPGDRLLESFHRPGSTPSIERPSSADRVDHVNSIRELGDRIADRLLVSVQEVGAAGEALLRIKDSVLPGTEVRIARTGDQLTVALTTDHAASFDLLASAQRDLQARLGDQAVVTLAFDPEGLISRQRMERAEAAGGGRESSERDHQRDSRDEGGRRRRREDEDERG
jgi:hypothetical protein